MKAHVFHTTTIQHVIIIVFTGMIIVETEMIWQIIVAPVIVILGVLLIVRMEMCIKKEFAMIKDAVMENVIQQHIQITHTIFYIIRNIHII